MKTRADDLAAELGRAHEQIRELKAKLALAEGERDKAAQHCGRMADLAWQGGAGDAAADAFARGWQAAREAAAAFHDERALFTDGRRAHLEANPGTVPDGIREDIIETEKESAAQDRIDAHYIRSLPLPEDADGAVSAAEEGLRRDLAATLEFSQENLRLVRAQRDRVKAMRDELRAIVEGRTDPPTDAECEAVIAEGGWFRWVAYEDGAPMPALRDPLFDPYAVPSSALDGVTRREGRTYSERWWCLDAQRKLRAWPVATEAPRG